MVKPKTTWKNPDNYIELIKDPWYKTIVEIQNIINLYTPQFYQNRNIKTLHLPVTTTFSCFLSREYPLEFVGELVWWC